MVKQRGKKGDYISYGGSPVKAIVNGKETGLFKDASTLLYYYMYDDPKTGKRKKQTCTRDIVIANKRFWNHVEKHKEEFIDVKEIKKSRKLRKQFKDNLISFPNVKIPKNYPIDPAVDDMIFEKKNTISEREYFEWLLSYKGREEELMACPCL